MTMTVTKYFAKNREVICAVQWAGKMTPEIQELICGRVFIKIDEQMQLQLGNGWCARIGDWIHSTSGEDVSVISDESFRMNYEEVDETSRVWPTAEEHEQAGSEFVRRLDTLLIEALGVSSKEHVDIFRDRQNLVLTLRRLLEDHAYVAAQRELARIRAKINKDL